MDYTVKSRYAFPQMILILISLQSELILMFLYHKRTDNIISFTLMEQFDSDKYASFECLITLWNCDNSNLYSMQQGLMFMVL